MKLLLPTMSRASSCFIVSRAARITMRIEYPRRRRSRLLIDPNGGLARIIDAPGLVRPGRGAPARCGTYSARLAARVRCHSRPGA